MNEITPFNEINNKLADHDEKTRNNICPKCGGALAQKKGNMVSFQDVAIIVSADFTVK